MKENRREIYRIIEDYRLKPVNPKNCGRQNCAPKHAYGPAIRDFYLLHFVVCGQGKFVTPRGEYTLRAGEIFIIRPYEVTYYEADESDPWEYIWLGFTAEMPLPQCLLSQDVLFAPSLEIFFQRGVEAKGFSFADGSASYEVYLSGIILSLIGCLMRGNSKKRAASDYVRQALSIIHGEYGKGSVTVSDIAKRLHLDRTYLSAIFKKECGTSPYKYLLKVRMEKAGEMLVRGTCNVTVAASSVGYSDVFVFSRAFKNYFKASPSEYVKEYANK